MDSDRQSDDAARVAALDWYDILDTPTEREFDDLAAIAAEVCDTPIAVVNLITDRRQFFKAEIGLGVREIPLETSFCRQALLEEDVLVVPDARQDARFDGNPIVHGEPGLRFYAGAVLRTPDGIAIGTMCVLDRQPREIDANALQTLRILARQAMTQIELKRANAENERRLAETQRLETQLRQIVDSAVDFGILTLDLDGSITSFSVGAEKITGWREEEVLGCGVDFLFVPEDGGEAPAEDMAGARDESGRAEDRWHMRKDGSQFWAAGETMPLRTEAGEHIGYLKILRDQTPEFEAERQRSDLMREMSHRMKNVLSTVQSIVSQSLRSARSLQEGQEAINSRLHALARAQDLLTQASWAGADIHRVVADGLAAHVTTDSANLTLEGPSVELSAQQVLGLSLALHELATNAAKYGALSVEGGRVSVTWDMDRDTGAFTFHWVETGGPAVTAPERSGFGSRLVQRIVGTYFGGRGSLAFAPEGVRFDLEGTVAV